MRGPWAHIVPLAVMQFAVNVVYAGHPILIVLALYVDRMRMRYLIMRPSREDVLSRDEPAAVTFLLGWADDFLPRLCGDQLGKLGSFVSLVHSLVSALLSGHYWLAIVICPIFDQHRHDLYRRELLVPFCQIISASLNLFKVG